MVESRALGADCILIILASVSDAQAHELESAAAAWGMAALLEVHTPEDLERAKLLKSPLVGINNRDLNTFETSLDTTKRLARGVPVDRLIVSESGLATRQDLAQVARYGIRCFLIGETLMREPNVEAADPRAPAQPLVAGGGVMADRAHPFRRRAAPRRWSTSRASPPPPAAPWRAAGSPWRRRRWRSSPPAPPPRATSSASPGSPGSWPPSAPPTSSRSATRSR